MYLATVGSLGKHCCNPDELKGEFINCHLITLQMKFFTRLRLFGVLTNITFNKDKPSGCMFYCFACSVIVIFPP
jgi:hypothetical protein